MKKRSNQRILAAISGILLFSLAGRTVPDAKAQEDPSVTFEQPYRAIATDDMWTYNQADVLQLQAGDIIVECEDGVLSGAGKDYYPNRFYNSQSGNFQAIAGTSNGYIVGLSGDDADPTAATDITYSMTVRQAGTYALYLVYDTKDESGDGVSKQAYFRIDDTEYEIPLSEEKFADAWDVRYLADSVTVDLTAGTHEFVVSSGTINRPSVKSVNADFVVVRLTKASGDETLPGGSTTEATAGNTTTSATTASTAADNTTAAPVTTDSTATISTATDATTAATTASTTTAPAADPTTEAPTTVQSTAPEDMVSTGVAEPVGVVVGIIVLALAACLLAGRSRAVSGRL